MGSIDIKSLLTVIKESLKALKQKRTYSIRKNWYSLFGILWGIPVPIATIGIDLYSANLSPTIHNIIERIILHPIHIFFLIHPLFFGIVFGAMGTVRHVKEQKIKEFEEDLISKNKKLQELDEMKSNFLSMVSHELRTPLTTVQGYITFLESEKTGNLNETQREFLKIAEEEAEHLNHLIEELLDLSRIEKGEFKVNLEQVDMKEIVTKAIISLQSFAIERQVTLEDKIPKDLPLVWADREKIFQVVINLLENAIKFNKHGGGVTLSYMDNAGDNRIIFCVSDTGIGIEEDKLNKIFDKFYKIEGLEKCTYRGCGLGLAITKSILELHQAKIWVETKIGEGSEFFFELQEYNKSK